MSKIHPGFKAVARSISKRQNIPMANADRILGAANAKHMSKIGAARHRYMKSVSGGYGH